MKRQLVLLAAAGACAMVGCNAPIPRFDPFLGRTTVPPPATGHIVSPVAGAADPYYPPGTNVLPGATGSTTPGVGITPSTSGTGSTAPQSIPITSQGSLNKRRTDRVARTSTPTPVESGTGTVQSSHASVIRIVDPEDDGAQSGLAAEPARFRPATGAVPIKSRSASTTAGRPSFSTTTADYAFDADYKWLTGSLEYSRTDRRWKLRYIPIDGDTDAYGGSVLLPETADLDNYQPGDFVTIRGQIAARGPDDRGFAPLYRYEQIERL